MPVDDDGKVNFTTTLFALIRENLNIKMRTGNFNKKLYDLRALRGILRNNQIVSIRLAEEMDQADDELRVTIQHIWPLQAKKMLDLLVPRNNVLNSGKLTVGKIYAGLLILESWRNTRFGQIDSGLPVSAHEEDLTLAQFPYQHIYNHNHCLDRILHVVFPIIKYVKKIFGGI